jgi:hypothetical protein
MDHDLIIKEHNYNDIVSIVRVQKLKLLKMICISKKWNYEDMLIKLKI